MNIALQGLFSYNDPAPTQKIIKNKREKPKAHAIAFGGKPVGKLR